MYLYNKILKAYYLPRVLLPSPSHASTSAARWHPAPTANHFCVSLKGQRHLLAPHRRHCFQLRSELTGTQLPLARDSRARTDPGLIPEQRRSPEPCPAPGEAAARSPSAPHAPTGAFPSAQGCSAGAPTSRERPGTAPGTRQRGKARREKGSEGRREGRSGCSRCPGTGCGAAAPSCPAGLSQTPTPHSPHSQPRGSCPGTEQPLP